MYFILLNFDILIKNKTFLWDSTRKMYIKAKTLLITNQRIINWLHKSWIYSNSNIGTVKSSNHSTNCHLQALMSVPCVTKHIKPEPEITLSPKIWKKKKNCLPQFDTHISLGLSVSSRGASLENGIFGGRFGRRKDLCRNIRTIRSGVSRVSNFGIRHPPWLFPLRFLGWWPRFTQAEPIWEVHRLVWHFWLLFHFFLFWREKEGLNTLLEGQWG